MPGGGPPWPGACCILYTPKISKNCPCNDGKNDGNDDSREDLGKPICLLNMFSSWFHYLYVSMSNRRESQQSQWTRLARHQHRPVMMRGFGTLGVWKCSDILDKETSNLRGTSRVSNFLWGFWAYQQCLDKWFSVSASFKSERKLWHVGLGDRFTLLCIEAQLKDHLCSHHQGVAINQIAAMDKYVITSIRRSDEAHTAGLDPGLHSARLSIWYHRVTRLRTTKICGSSSDCFCNGFVLLLVPASLKYHLCPGDETISINQITPMDKDILAAICRSNEAHTTILYPSLNSARLSIGQWRGRPRYTAIGCAHCSTTLGGNRFALGIVPTGLKNHTGSNHQSVAVHQCTTMHKDIRTAIGRCNEAHTSRLNPCLDSTCTKDLQSQRQPTLSYTHRLQVSDSTFTSPWFSVFGCICSQLANTLLFFPIRNMANKRNSPSTPAEMTHVSGLGHLQQYSPWLSTQPIGSPATGSTCVLICHSKRSSVWWARFVESGSER